MDLLECSLCNYQYDEDKRRARNLTCGHYFCQYCLDKIIKSPTPHCPTCRKHISAQSAQMLTPNFLMDDLISKMKTGKVSVNSEGSDEDFSAGSCPKHRKCQLYFNCRTHNVKICRDCTVVQHPPSKCQIISFEDEMEETKKIDISDLKTQKLNREKNISDLQNIISDTNSKIREKNLEIAELLREVIEYKQVKKSANEAVQNCMENKNKIQKIQRELNSSKTINEIKHSCQNAKQIISVSKAIGMSLEQNFKFASSKSFQDLIDQSPDEFANAIFHGADTIQATAEVNDEKCYAQLMVKNGDIHLPALASRSRPLNPRNTITVSSLLRWYPTTDADIFMTLASDENELGTVYVRLKHNDFANYIRKLCMGTIGPSYRGTIFTGKNSSSIWTGNVSQYDSSSCLERIPSKPTLVRLQRGTVYLEDTTGLGFQMTESIFSFYGVGNVINGMSVLDVAWKYPNGKITIKDVGIVLTYY